MIREQILWTEAYRPQTIDDCIIPDNIKKTFKEFVAQNKIPNLLLSGGPGIGKTTVAKALCKEVGCDYMVINGSDDNGIDTIRNKVKNYASSVSLSGGRKVIILDESDYLSPNAQAALRNSIEEFAINCSFIFTCNYKNRIIEPLHSRCSVIEIKVSKDDKQKMMAKFFKRICWILDKENITYNKEVIAQIISKYYPDNRRILNELQRFAASGTINAGVLGQSADINISQLVKFLKSKDFGSIRTWIVENNDIDVITLHRKLYDAAYDFLKPNSIPQLVLLIAKYQYQHAFVADQEINLLALFTEIMIDCEFK